MNSAKNSSKIAICGILTALSLVMMIVAGFFGFLTYAVPMLAGGLLIVPVEEYGTQTALTVFAAVSLLSFILVADKESAVFYFLLFGHYPIIQPMLDKISSRCIRFILKALVFNGCSVLSVWLAQIIFGIPIFEENLPTWLLILLYLMAANFCFVLYDRALRQFYTLYDIKFRTFIDRLKNK